MYKTKQAPDQGAEETEAQRGEEAMAVGGAPQRMRLRGPVTPLAWLCPPVAFHSPTTRIKKEPQSPRAEPAVSCSRKPPPPYHHGEQCLYSRWVGGQRSGGSHPTLSRDAGGAAGYSEGPGSWGAPAGARVCPSPRPVAPARPDTGKNRENSPPPTPSSLPPNLQLHLPHFSAPHPHLPSTPVPTTPSDKSPSSPLPLAPPDSQPCSPSPGRSHGVS